MEDEQKPCVLCITFGKHEGSCARSVLVSAHMIHLARSGKIRELELVETMDDIYGATRR